MSNQPTAEAAGTIDLGGDLTINRLGFGAMRITGSGIWGEPPSRDQAIATLRRVVELGVNFIDTADSYGPAVSEELIAEAMDKPVGTIKTWLHRARLEVLNQLRRRGLIDEDRDELP